MINWCLTIFVLCLQLSSASTELTKLNIEGYTSFIGVKEEINDLISNKTIDAVNFVLKFSSAEPTGLLSYTSPDVVIFFQLFHSVVKDDLLLTNLLLQTAKAFEKDRRRKHGNNFRLWLENKFNFAKDDIYYFVKTIANGKSKGLNNVSSHLTEQILLLNNKYKIVEEACSFGDVATMKWFLESNFQLKDLKMNVVEDSFRKGHISIIELLLKHNYLSIVKPPIVFLKGQYNDKQTFLHVAAAAGLNDVINYLLNEGVDINFLDALGRTPLYRAVESNQVEVIKTLVKGNANMSTLFGELGDTILHVAAFFKNAESVKTLIESDLSVELVNNRGEGPVHIVARNFSPDVLNVLKKFKANMNSKDLFGDTPLHVASHEGNLDAVRLLIKHGAILYERNNVGQIPLFKSVENGHMEIIKEFANKNPSLVHLTTTTGDTIMHVAADVGNIEVMQMLLKLGASASVHNSRQQIPLLRAALKGNIRAVKFLRNLTDLRAVNSGLNLLHNAVLEGNINAVTILVDSGVNIDTRGLWDNTALHVAAGLGFTDVVQVLLEKRADPNNRNKNLMTPLHKAALSGHLDAIRHLIDARADTSMKDSSGKTPLDLAKMQGHSTVIEYLSTLGINT